MCQGKLKENYHLSPSNRRLQITFLKLDILQEGISDILDDVTNRFMFGDWRLLQVTNHSSPLGHVTQCSPPIGQVSYPEFLLVWRFRE